MGKWNIHEVLGKTYVYASKNVASDIAANNYFGIAAAWVSGGTCAVGDRCTSASIQYYNKTGINTTTAPASDATNWGFDKSNFQQYATGQIYNIGDKTRYNNLHYTCIVNGTTGTWNANNWTQVVISNRDVPFKLMNTAITLLNSDARFVSSETLDLTNNIATHSIYLVLSNGIWNETLINPTKFTRVVGMSKWKTQLNKFSILTSNFFFDNIYIFGLGDPLTSTAGINIKSSNCVYNTLNQAGANNGVAIFYFFYKNIVKSFYMGSNSYGTAQVYHFVSNTILSMSTSNQAFSFFTNSVFKNNYIKGTAFIGILTELQKIPLGYFDYNSFEGSVYIGNTLQTTLSMLQTSLPNQNIYSRFDTGITLNTDFTLPTNSPLLGNGSNGNNIGAEGVGYVQSNVSSIFDSASGAIYKNITKYGTALIREQISKIAQSGGTNTITLETNASAVDSLYNGFRIYISAGTGIGQTKTITGYTGSTKIATVDTNWTTIPDNSSVYEILDGEVISAVGDLGSVQPIRKLLYSTTNVFDSTGFVIYQNVSTDDAKNDNSVNLNYEMRTGLTNDLSAMTYFKFKQDAYLEIDNNGYGNGDNNYNPDNAVVDFQVFRYFQIKIKFHK